MAAPQKAGLDYYPRSTDLLKDRKFVKAKIKYGYLSIVVYDALLEMIYKDKGYYLTYTEDTKDDIAWDILESVRGKYPVEASTIYEVIGMLVECRLFSHDHFKQGIITSKRIQETYYKCTVERKNVEVDNTIWMLSIEEMKALSTKSSILPFLINQPINGVNQPINRQSKVNKSKVKERKVEIEEGQASAPTLDDVKIYAGERKSSVDPERFFDYYKSRNWKCGNTVIADWKAMFRCWEKNEKPKQNADVKTTKFVNYNQPTYTDEEIEVAIKRKKEREKNEK